MTDPDRPQIRKVPSQTSISLVSAGTVLTSDPGGMLEEGTYHGVYHRDLRILSRYLVAVDDEAPNVLRSARRDASSMDTVMATSFNEYGDARAVLVRHRRITDVVEDRYELHRLTEGPPMVLRIRLAADFAHLMEVKGNAYRPAHRTLESDGPGVFGLRSAEGAGLRVTIEGEQPKVDGDALEWLVDPSGRTAWSLRLTIAPDPPSAVAVAELTAPAPLEVIASDHRWGRAIEGAVADLASLRMEEAGERFTAAGAPWFMALFGRDSLLSAQAALPLGTEPVLDTLEALARRQGQVHDDRSLEQPGRILHELRTGVVGVFGLEAGEAYFGTADATPLFVLVLAEASRWGADPDRVRDLLPAARDAVRWCVEHGDIDGDGFVEAVAHETGIENQGWKDSGDSMVHADGSLAPTPIALIEVQAYVHAALEGLADLEERFGDPAAVAPLRERASELSERTAAAFWSDRLGGLAMGLDADKRPLLVAASNMGHALWTNLLPAQMRSKVADRVTSTDLFDSWGIRTLGSDEIAYSPLAYHRGSIWPHDTAIIAHGLARSGATLPLQALAEEMLSLAENSDYRLPELLGGTSRDELPAPVPYPVACSPQAWSAAAPLLMLRSVLGLEPDVPGGTLRLSPVLPADQTLHVTGLRLGSSEISVHVGPDGVRVEGAEDAGLEVIVG